MGINAKPHAELGRRISQGRKEIGLSVAEFARLVELSQNHVYVLERGEKRPHRRKLNRIGNVLGKRVEWLISGKGRKNLRNGEQNGGES